MSEVYKIIDFNAKTMIITSVERLSDNQMFKLGDQVMHKNNVSRREGVIAKFEAYISSGSMFVQCNNDGSGYNIPLSYLLSDEEQNASDEEQNASDKMIEDELRCIYMEMRGVRNEIRDRYDKAIDYIDAGRLKLEIDGADKMITVMETYLKNR